MQLNLNSCFPIGMDGKQGPLPKQLEFFNEAIKQDGAKFIAYVGGVGSGKSLIGCITTLAQAVMYGGEYLIARQFMPELRQTTYKTFLEICPPELILEHKIADATLTIKSAAGKPALILFRQLEDPDKLRSLNLSGFYVDEANQISEEAFLLLQGRLRNHKGLRKGILTTNPKGHDYIFNYFVKQDMFKEFPDMRKQFYLIKAPSTENIHLPEGYIQNMLATYSKERVQREVMGSFDSFEGQVYSEFRRDAHVIKPFKIPDNWIRIVGIDHGYRNPSAWIWAAIDPDGVVFVYREFYESGWLVSEIVKGNNRENKRGVFQLMQGEKIDVAAIDPSVRNRSGVKGESILDEYMEHVPNDFPLIMANNKKELGIDRVKRYLKLDTKIGKPMMYIFDNCTNLIEEMVKYRYEELSLSSVGKKAEKEEPRKIDDHALDALRYLIMTRPEPYVVKQEELQNMRNLTPTLRKFQMEMQKFKKQEKKSDIDSI